MLLGAHRYLDTATDIAVDRPAEIELQDGLDWHVGCPDTEPEAGAPVQVHQWESQSPLEDSSSLLEQGRQESQSEHCGQQYQNMLDHRVPLFGKNKRP